MNIKQEIIAACNENGQAVDDYIEDYELDADEGVYTPSETERFLIWDAVNGLLADDHFIETFVKWRLLINQKG